MRFYECEVESWYDSDLCGSKPNPFGFNAHYSCLGAPKDETYLPGRDFSVTQPWLTSAVKEMGQRRFMPDKGNNPRILEYFKATSYKTKSQNTPWCAAFVNWCLLQNSINGTHSAAAISFSNYGVKLNSPAFGAIAVLSFHHVAFIWGKTHGGKIGILGGNQGPTPNGVNIGAVPSKLIVQIRYPLNFTPDYDLPFFSGKKTYHLDMKSTR